MKLVIIKAARADIWEINEYLFEFGEKPLNKFRESFEKFCSQVSDMPYRFIQYEQNPKYRKAVIAFGYLVFYQVDSAGSMVKIYRVLHGRRNMEPLLE